VHRIEAAGHRAPLVRDGSLRVPILLYHHVGPSGRRWRSLFVSLPQFARQMAAIAKSGAATLTMEELYDAVRSGRSFPHGAVALTFDDATEDQYVFAFPILRQYRLHATFFVPTGLVGRSGYVTWDQLREMSASGLVGVEAHSVSHRDLTALTPAEATSEITGSREALRERLGVRARQFAYPFGKFGPGVERILRAAGFESAVTTRYEWSHSIRSPLAWGRMEVHDTNAPENLAALASMSGDRRK
jgi:peptidoglycan/xylan/chitin deacetylase (PgdA/CDA1 family)